MVLFEERNVPRFSPSMSKVIAKNETKKEIFLLFNISYVLFLFFVSPCNNAKDENDENSIKRKKPKRRKKGKKIAKHNDMKVSHCVTHIERIVVVYICNCFL